MIDLDNSNDEAVFTGEFESFRKRTTNCQKFQIVEAYDPISMQI